MTEAKLAIAEPCDGRAYEARGDENNLKMLFLDDGRRLLLSKGGASNRSEKHATE